MRSLFEHSSFYWVRYGRYELRRDANSLLYITPAATLTDEERPVRLCRECMEPFIAESPDAFVCPNFGGELTVGLSRLIPCRTDLGKEVQRDHKIFDLKQNFSPEKSGEKFCASFSSSKDGGGRWIRTTEVVDNRFTVCPI